MKERKEASDDDYGGGSGLGGFGGGGDDDDDDVDSDVEWKAAPLYHRQKLLLQQRSF